MGKFRVEILRCRQRSDLGGEARARSKCRLNIEKLVLPAQKENVFEIERKEFGVEGIVVDCHTERRPVQVGS